MIEFIKKYYIYIIIVTTLFVLSVFMIWRSVGIFFSIKQQYKQLQQIQLDYALAQEFINSIYKIKQNDKLLDEFYSNVSVFLPSTDEKKVELFSTLEQLSEETGNESIELTVVESSMSREGDIKPLTNDYLNIKITLVGNYNDLIYFMQKIENMHYFSDVLGFEIKKTADSTKKEDEDKEMREDLIISEINVVFYLDVDEDLEKQVEKESKNDMDNEENDKNKENK